MRRKIKDNAFCVVCKKDERVHKYLESLDDELWNTHDAVWEENLRCKHCYHLHDEHRDWIATGEYSPASICPEAYEEGKFQWFEAMDNLAFLEWKDKEHEDNV